MLIALLWVIALAVINPAGEFPVNDDWAYTKNVFQLSANNKFYVDPWPAMTLVSQTLYGTLFTKVFGFSFLVLRISTFVLALASSIILFQILKRKCANDYVAFLLSAGFCFGQIFCALSFTFMTDIFFLSFTVFSVYTLILYLDHQKTKHYLLFTFFCLIAVLNRQHGLLLPLLILFPIISKKNLSVKTLFLAAFPFITCLGGHLGYRFLLWAYSIPQNMQGLGKLTESIKNINLQLAHINTGDFFLTLGWMLLPCALFLLWKQREKNPKKTLLFAGILLISTCITWSALKLYPIGNISNLYGTGPKFQKDSAINIANRFNVAEWYKWTVRVISLFSVSFLIFKSVAGKNKFFEDKKLNASFIFSICVFILVYLIFSIANDAYFDRYVLPVALFLLLLNAPQIHSLKFSFKIIAPFIILLVYLVTIFQVKDFMNWNRLRWKVLADMNRKGISPHFIDGGFEYNAWFKPRKVFPPAYENKSWYWVDKDDFMIAGGNYPGYFKKEFYPYQHYIPFTTDTLYVLEKKDKTEFDLEGYNKKIRQLEDEIRKDKNWLNNTQLQAKENKIPLDSMIRLNAIWTMENSSKK
ncbi:MAG: glycosyltransferase family 39 protein [Bacteroidia bacterium]|nr:glycosyltransferase family 39 protein [Bacteroidia bacterium]